MAGKVSGIPLYESFPRLGEYIPSIQKGSLMMITANSGVGKTQAWKGIFLKSVFDYLTNHPDTNIKPQFILFLLEESQDEFIDSLFSMLLYKRYKIEYSPLQLSSEHKKELPEDIIQKLESIQEEAENIMSYIIIVDSIYNPTGCYKFCREKSNEWGVHYWCKLHHQEEVITAEEYSRLELREKETYKYSHYVPNDENQIVIVLTDNVNIWQEESGLTRHETIGKWSKDYCRKQMSKHWHWAVINIVQQSADSEKQSFDFKGNSIVNKVKPSLDGLGNNKEIQRDHLQIFGLFAPSRYGIDNYEGYDVKRLGDTFRVFSVLKNRLGISNIEVPMLFKGTVCNFIECPK